MIANLPARLPDHRRTQGRHDGAACGAGRPPGRLRQQPQGAEVLAVRRRPTAGLVRPRGPTLPAGVDLAAPTSTPHSSTARASTRRAARARRSTSGAAAPTDGSPRRLPDVRLIAVVRDPIDRAYSNWMHLWSDGLEPEPDFETAFARQDERVAAGWAPFWRYRELGLYGEQLAHLLDYVDRRPDPGAALPRPDRRPAHRGRPRLPLPRDPRGSGRLPSRGTTRAASSGRAGGHRCSARRSGPAPGSASSPRPACGAGPACR